MLWLVDGIVDPNGSFLDHTTTALLQCLTAPQPEEDVHDVSTLDLQKFHFCIKNRFQSTSVTVSRPFSDARLFFFSFFRFFSPFSWFCFPAQILWPLKMKSHIQASLKKCCEHNCGTSEYIIMLIQHFLWSYSGSSSHRSLRFLYPVRYRSDPHITLCTAQGGYHSSYSSFLAF